MVTGGIRGGDTGGGGVRGGGGTGGVGGGDFVPTINYWAPLTRQRHIPPHPAQPQHTNHGARRMPKLHQQEHRPQRPTESSNRRNMRREERVTVQAP